MKRLTLLFLMSSAACAHAPAKARTTPLPQPADALAKLRESGERRKNLRAMGRLTYFGEKGRVRLKAVIVVDRPARFRFETVSPFEQPIDVMACNGSRLWLLSKEKLAEGAATPENIAKLVPLPLKPEEIVDTMLGGVPTSSRFTPVKLEWDEHQDGRWLMTMAGQGGETGKLSIDPDKQRIMAMTLLEADGRVRVSVEFDDFEAAKDAGEVPRSIHAKMPARDLDVEIKLKEVDINVALEASLFRIQPPPGVIALPMEGIATATVAEPRDPRRQSRPTQGPESIGSQNR
jgi:outer membrane lipoprotein-sorting protein